VSTGQRNVLFSGFARLSLNNDDAGLSQHAVLHHIEPDSVAEIERAGACALGLRVISYGEWEISEIAKR
jgi:hypothetical protein